MSAIASFYLMDRSDLPGLVEAAASKPGAPYDYLTEHARDLDSEGDLFSWSGYVTGLACCAGPLRH